MVLKEELNRIKYIIAGCKRARQEVELVHSPKKMKYLEELLAAEKHLEMARSVLKELL